MTVAYMKCLVCPPMNTDPVTGLPYPQMYATTSMTWVNLCPHIEALVQPRVVRNEWKDEDWERHEDTDV